VYDVSSAPVVEIKKADPQTPADGHDSDDEAAPVDESAGEPVHGGKKN
jgi:hypothetical protein